MTRVKTLVGLSDEAGVLSKEIARACIGYHTVISQ